MSWTNEEWAAILKWQNRYLTDEELRVKLATEQRHHRVRCAVASWLIISKRAGVVRDIRLLIGSMLWSTKEDVIWYK